MYIKITVDMYVYTQLTFYIYVYTVIYIWHIYISKQIYQPPSVSQPRGNNTTNALLMVVEVSTKLSSC